MPGVPALAPSSVIAPPGWGRVETMVKASKDVLTTGDVARACRVTIRTVINWYERGRLQGYRLPGSRDRRFTREAVVRFMRENDLPFDLLDGPAGEGRRVLVVDDDEGVRTMVCRFLRGLGVVEVESAASGWEAGLRMASFQPRVLLLDFRLGDTTGDKVLATIRGTRDIRQPAIVIMSAHLGDEEAAALREAGADAVIGKPFDLDALRDVVYRHVGIA